MMVSTSDLEVLNFRCQLSLNHTDFPGPFGVTHNDTGTF